MSARFQLERARGATEALGLIGLPALVLNERGKVLAANHLIEALTGYVHWRAQDRVALKDGGADTLLRDAIARLDAEGGQGVRSFPVRGAGDQPAMVAHLLPIRRTARDFFYPLRRGSGDDSCDLAAGAAGRARAIAVRSYPGRGPGRPQSRCRRNRRGHGRRRQRLAQYDSHASEPLDGKNRLQPPGRGCCSPQRDFAALRAKGLTAQSFPASE